MRRLYSSIAFSALIVAPVIASAQAQAGDANRAVAGGGVMVPGWQGRGDRNASIADAKFMKEGDAFHVTTGPAVTYWNPSNTAKGDYMVKAKFTEPKYMNLNSHDHPYGVMIAGNDLGTDNQSYLYCAAYGDGSFIVRGFGGSKPSAADPTKMTDAVFQVVDTGVTSGGRAAGPTPNAAVHKAAGPGQPVEQEIAFGVKGNKVECSINGTVVSSVDKAKLVGPGKLKSLDGVYGIRFAHNTEGIVTGFGLAK